jgi:hypothetical protein
VRARAWFAAQRASVAAAIVATSTLHSAVLHAEDSRVLLVPDELDVTDLPPWSLRLGMLGGLAVPSLHERILAEEGYSGPRWAFMVSAERRVHGHFGIGLLGLYALRSIDASLRENATSVAGPSPTYSEHSWVGAVDFPISFLLGRPRGTFATELCLVPWVGAGAGKLELYDQASWHAGPVFGGELRLLWRGRRVVGGFSVGGYSLRVSTPGGVSDPVDLGMFFLSAVGGFDVG